MAHKYTTEEDVRAWINSRTSMTDNDILHAIEMVEGLIETKLKIGSGTGAFSLTYSSAKLPHRVLWLAATAGAASIAIMQSTPSFQTMESYVAMQEQAARWWQAAWKLIEDEDTSDFIVSQ